MTVEGAIAESEGSTEVTVEAEDLVTSSEEIQGESGSSLTITRILTTYTSDLEYTSTGVSTTTVGSDSGAETENDYTSTTTTTSFGLIQYIGCSLITVYMLLF